MSDLSVRVVHSIGRAQIEPPSPTLNVQLLVIVRVADSAIPAIGLLALPPDEVVHGRANTVSVIDDNPAAGEVAFNASPDHVDVTSYTANIRVYGSSTVTATQNLGKPTPDGNGVIIVDLTTTFAGLAAGNYTVSILTTAPGGSVDSTESAPFALPLG